MERYKAYWILDELMDDADGLYKEALVIAMNDVEFVDLMPDDMVHVVRCKDCIHYDTKTGICFNPAGLSASGLHTANNYCSSGKRKEIEC